MKNLKLYLLAAGLLIASALAFGQPGAPCQDWKYYFADITSPTSTDIYGVTLSGSDADLSLIATDTNEVHIAYNDTSRVLYLVRKSDGAVATMDPSIGLPSLSIYHLLSMSIPEITTATFDSNHDLIIGSQSLDKIWSVDITTWVATPYDDYSPIYGGDLEFDAIGDLYLAAGTKLYKNEIDPISDTFITVLNSKKRSTGLALMDNGDLISSYAFSNQLKEHTTAGVFVTNYDLKLGGVPHIAQNGDMTSGCNDDEPFIECQALSTFYVHHGPGVVGSDLYEVFFGGGMATLSYKTSVGYEAHIAYNAPADTIYMVSKYGSFVDFYNPVTDMFSAGSLPLIPARTEITAAVFNESNGLLYLGSGTSDEIYEVNVLTGANTVFATGIPVSGGDLAIQGGKLYLATRTGSSLYEIVGGMAIPVGGILPTVTGMAQAFAPTSLITSHYGSTSFEEISASTGFSITSYPVILGGSPFTLLNGDMAAGCGQFAAPKSSAKLPQAESNEKSGLNSYPNPTIGNSEVVFKTTTTGQTTLEVVDMNGRIVATLFSAVADKDQEYRLSYDASGLTNGIYIYRLTTQNEVVMSKFMIAR